MTQPDLKSAIQHLALAGISARPESAVVLGSGFGQLEDLLESPTEVPYGQIPGFAKPAGTAGHQCRLSVGRLGGRLIAVFRGRYHHYEGHSPRELVMPVRLAHALGCQSLLLTNAAGGIAKGLNADSLMVIADHLNLLGINPLMGPERMPGAPRFPAMAGLYVNQSTEQLKSALAACDEPITEGVYAAVSGPSFETSAEVKMLRAIGADAVGMSTVPEAIAAHALGMQVAGLSLITNRAGGPTDNHNNTLSAAKENNPRLIQIIKNWCS